jgi:membrane protease subunit HflC
VRVPLWGWVGLAVALLLVLTSALVAVPETEQLIVLRLGKPDRIVNAFSPREPIGRSGAGLAVIVPVLESTISVDKRIRDLDMPEQTVLSTDQLRLVVDAFARYRIVDPLRMYETRGSEEAVATQLTQILSSRLRNELGKMPFAALLSPERGALMEAIQADVNRQARGIGAEIIDLRIKKADLPTGTPLDGAYARMRSAREQETRTILAEGSKRGQLLKAQADAQAAQIYAKSYGADPQFYAFYRAMQAYRQAFKDGNATIVMTPDNAFLREFEGGKER